MNIIISSLNDIKTTGSNRDIDSLTLFVEKTILDTENKSITDWELSIVSDDGTYFLTPQLMTSLAKMHYYAYKLIPSGNTDISKSFGIPDGEYTFHFGTDLSISIQIVNTAGLQDEHEAILIVGRKINAIKTEIIAQDQNSQQFTFYLKKKYDGVNLFDSVSKQVSIDYIPVNKEDCVDEEGNACSFLSDYNIEVYGDADEEPVFAPDGQIGEWVMLKWNLPYLATKTAGVVRFAIAITERSGNIYTWQTAPSSFTVSANLGVRQNAGVVVEQVSSILEEIDNRLTSIEESDIYNFDLDNPNTEFVNEAQDGEIILGGGGAPTGGNV